jgi:hypothetical protein
MASTCAVALGFHEVPTLPPASEPPFDIDAPMITQPPPATSLDTAADVDRVVSRLCAAFHEGILAWPSVVEALVYAWVSLGAHAYDTRGLYRYATAAEITVMCRTLGVRDEVLAVFAAVCDMYGFDAFAVPMYDDGGMSFAFPLAAAASSGFAGLAVGRNEARAHGTNACFRAAVGTLVMLAHLTLQTLVTRWPWPQTLTVRAGFRVRSVLLPSSCGYTAVPELQCRGGLWYIGIGRVPDWRVVRAFLRHVTAACSGSSATAAALYDVHVVDFEGCIPGDPNVPFYHDAKTPTLQLQAAFTVTLCWLPTTPRPPIYITADAVTLQLRHALVLLAATFMLGCHTFVTTDFAAASPLDPDGRGTLLRLLDRYQRNPAILAALGVRDRAHMLPRLTHRAQLFQTLCRWMPTLTELANRILRVNALMFGGADASACSPAIDRALSTELRWWMHEF